MMCDERGAQMRQLLVSLQLASFIVAAVQRSAIPVDCQRFTLPQTLRIVP